MIGSLAATDPRGGDSLAPSVLIEFRRAQTDVAGRTGTSFRDLGCGRLAGADYLAAFTRGVGAELIEAFWTPAQVRGFARNACWDAPDVGMSDHLDRYWSARRFLETCVATGSGIRFAYSSPP